MNSNRHLLHNQWLTALPPVVVIVSCVASGRLIMSITQRGETTETTL